MAGYLGFSKGNAVGLNLKTPLYVGGVDTENIRLSMEAGIYAGFHGCISSVRIILEQYPYSSALLRFVIIASSCLALQLILLHISLFGYWLLRLL